MRALEKGRAENRRKKRGRIRTFELPRDKKSVSCRGIRKVGAAVKERKDGKKKSGVIEVV